MKQSILLALMALVLPLGAAAQEEPAPVGEPIPRLFPCDFLTDADVAAWYPGLKGENSTLEQKAGTRDAPSNFRNDTCVRTGEIRAKSGDAHLVIESFPPSADMAKVAAWYKTMEEEYTPEERGYESVVMKKVGEAECETGKYIVTDTDKEPFYRHYVACEQIHGRYHLVINLQWSNDKAYLPSVQKTKALLDLVVSRLEAATAAAKPAGG